MYNLNIILKQKYDSGNEMHTVVPRIVGSKRFSVC